jgi:hypothetical protein
MLMLVFVLNLFVEFYSLTLTTTTKTTTTTAIIIIIIIMITTTIIILIIIITTTYNRLKSQPYYNVYTPLDPEECLTVLKHFSDKRLNIQSNSARVRFLPRKSVFPSVGFEPTSLAHCSTNSLSYIYIR